MSRILTTVLVLIASVFALVGLPDDASAQKRVAFVVGTDKYDNLDKTRQLQRAVNDARAVGAAFKALGFEVVAAENLTRGQFNNEWQRFLDKLTGGDTAAIYYAGHGVEIEGLNFLLPRDIPDIKFGRQEQIKRESLSVAEILLDLRGRNPEIALVILDACRDNPLIPDEMRSAGTRGGGLAPLKGEPPKGTFIMYSAGAGESALDRLPGSDPDRENSIFTRKLVPLLKTKGLALHDMARQLRVDVIELASTVPHAQRPAYYDGVVGKYCLAGCEGAAIAPKHVEPSATSQGASEAERPWALVKDTTSPAALEAFIKRFGDTFYGDLAKARLADLKQAGTAAPYTGGGSKGEWRKTTVPVDAFPANAWGLHNVHGNVWEWTGDCWNEKNAGNPGNGSARVVGDCASRVLRGGSWADIPQLLRSANRFKRYPEGRTDDVGFRVARMLTP
jgi:hypothetical protein